MLVGQMKPTQLWETTLDPENRNLIQLTTDDVKKDAERFAVLHGNKASEERKKLVATFKINFEDIDT